MMKRIKTALKSTFSFVGRNKRIEQLLLNADNKKLLAIANQQKTLHDLQESYKNLSHRIEGLFEDYRQIARSVESLQDNMSVQFKITADSIIKHAKRVNDHQFQLQEVTINKIDRLHNDLCDIDVAAQRRSGVLTKKFNELSKKICNRDKNEDNDS